MTGEALKFMKNLFSELDIPYQFEEWTSNPVPDPYWVGEFIESASLTKEENGYQETAFILTGTGETWINLLSEKEKIENNISRRTILPNGNGLIVLYSDSQPIETGDDRLKRIQINISIMEWSVNENGNW